MSVRSDSFSGSVSVNRHLHVGGKATLEGSAHIGHDLKVDGWLDAPNVKGVIKGVFGTREALVAAYPYPEPGWIAGVGTALPCAAYNVRDGEWSASPCGTIDVGISLDVVGDLHDRVEGLLEVSEELAGRVEQLETNPPIEVVDTELGDIVLGDGDGNPVAIFGDGHIKTANFDSSQINLDIPIEVVDTELGDLALGDGDGNPVAIFGDGHIKTANFDSAEVIDGTSTVYAKGVASDSNVTTDTPTCRYRGLNRAMDASYILKYIDMARDTSDQEGDTVTILAGQIDQRGWLVNQHSVEGRIVAVTDGVARIVPTGFFVLNSGDHVFVSVKSTATNIISQKSSSSGSMFCILEYGTADSSDISVTARTDIRFKTMTVVVAEWSQSNLWQSIRSAATNATEAIAIAQSMQTSLSSLLFLTDTVTGSKYRLTVADGVLGIKAAGIANVLVVGNSFTNHAPKPEYGWSCTRGMAASTDYTDYCAYLADGLGAHIERATLDAEINGATFERGYSPSFNFSRFGFDRTRQYELIIIQLSENATYSDTMQATWEALYQYFQDLYPDATVLQVIGWHSANKTAALTAACTAKGVTLLNCNSDTYTGNLTAGAYILGSDSQQYPVTQTIVTHPSDIGMLLIANRILQAVGYNALDYLHDITVDPTDGVTISTMYSGHYAKGAYRGLVSLSVSGASNVTVTGATSGRQIAVTKISGSVYTLLMPNEDVTVKGV